MALDTRSVARPWTSSHRTPRSKPCSAGLWNRKTCQLSEGDNIIGRDPRSDVWLDVPGVSRRHAIIRVNSSNRRVMLEDLGSTNGTFVRRARVDGEVALTDGDLIRVGTVDLTVRLWATDTATETKRIRRRTK